MKIATWNVNSLKVRLPQVVNWLESTQCDVLCLQETKLSDEQFPESALTDLGYHVAYSGQKTYNGVAIISKNKVTQLQADVDGLDDPQRRILMATFDNGVRIINLYVVNGSEVGTDKFYYKLNWLKKVKQAIELELKTHKHCVVLGDFNIAPQDDDVYDPKRWHNKILCSKEERDALGEIKSLGFIDSYRYFNPDKTEFSWWDYRNGGFEKNLGLRIDLILNSGELQKQALGCQIDIAPRSNEQPSDHTPVICEYDL